MSPRPIELPEPEFESARRAAREGRFSEALDAVRQALAESREGGARDGAAATALSEVSRQAEAGGDLSVSEQAIALAVELKPRFPDLHLQHACVLLSRQRRPEARRALEQALRLHPRFTAARLELALLDAREGLVAESLAALRELSHDTTVGDPAAFQQGLESIERAEWDDAEPLLRRALDLTDPVLQEKLRRFRAHHEAGETARALAILEEVLPRHAGYPDLHYLAGLAELKLGRNDDALASFARALELNPRFLEARVQLARTLDGLGDPERAAEQVGRVLDLDAGNRGAQELTKSWEGRGRRPRRGAANRPPVEEGRGRSKGT